MEVDCNYCDLTSLKSLQFSNSITHLNVRSFKKTDKLSIIISILHFPAVICLSKTWLKANELIENVPNYFLYLLLESLILIVESEQVLERMFVFKLSSDVVMMKRYILALIFY